jgi:hypothetical protein
MELLLVCGLDFIQNISFLIHLILVKIFTLLYKNTDFFYGRG